MSPDRDGFDPGPSGGAYGFPESEAREPEAREAEAPVEAGSNALGEAQGAPLDAAQPDEPDAARAGDVQVDEARAAGDRDATEAMVRAHRTEQIDLGHPTVQIDPTRRGSATGERAGHEDQDEFSRPTEQINLERRSARPDADHPGAAGPADGGAPVPVLDDVMVLPEPDGDRTRVPEQVGGRSDGSFWLTAIENGETWPDEEPGPVRMQTVTETRPRRIEVPKQPRRPAFGLMALVVLALLGSFFAWTSAAPLWLAVGHGETGTVTVTRCTGAGTTQRCAGTFVADGGWTAQDVSVLGNDGSGRAAGTVLPARMVGADSGQAYANASGWTLHVRWVIGVALVLLCGLGIASATGARRLETARARRRAVLASIGAPLVVLAGFLVAAF